MTQATVEDIVKVSPKGQIVIPKQIRKRLGVSTGERLLVMSRDEEILIKKLGKISIDQISQRVADTAKAKGIDVEKLLNEAVEWARKSK